MIRRIGRHAADIEAMDETGERRSDLAISTRNARDRMAAAAAITAHSRIGPSRIAPGDKPSYLFILLPRGPRYATSGHDRDANKRRAQN